MAHAERRTRLIAALIAVPAMAVALGLGGIEAYRLVRPDSAIFGDPPPASLADAITRGYAVEHAYAFIRAGQDPNDAITVDDPEYTAGRSIGVSPLMLAVAARNGRAVQMLLSAGARLDLPQNRMVTCLALELGDEDIVGIIDRHSSEVPQTCSDQRLDAATPLLGWAQAAIQDQ